MMDCLNEADGRRLLCDDDWREIEGGGRRPQGRGRSSTHDLQSRGMHTTSTRPIEEAHRGGQADTAARPISITNRSLSSSPRRLPASPTLKSSQAHGGAPARPRDWARTSQRAHPTAPFHVHTGRRGWERCGTAEAGNAETLYSIDLRIGDDSRSSSSSFDLVASYLARRDGPFGSSS